MEVRLIEAIIVFLVAATTALQLWNKSRIEKVAKDIDGKMQQLITAEKKVSFTEGKVEGHLEGQSGTKFPGV